MSLTQEQFALLSRGIIDIRDEIHEDTFDYVRECIAGLVANDSPDIMVWITSDGGDLNAAFGIYDMLRNYEGVVTGLVIGTARSSALLILQACDERQAHANATVFLHNPIYRVRYAALAHHVRTQDIKEFDALRKRVIAIMAEWSKLTRGQVAKMLSDETTLFADQAKKAGFVDTLI